MDLKCFNLLTNKQCKTSLNKKSENLTVGLPFQACKILRELFTILDSLMNLLDAICNHSESNDRVLFLQRLKL